jgi:hypothetical protein
LACAAHFGCSCWGSADTARQSRNAKFQIQDSSPWLPEEQQITTLNTAGRLEAHTGMAPPPARGSTPSQSRKELSAIAITISKST